VNTPKAHLAKQTPAVQIANTKRKTEMTPPSHQEKAAALIAPMLKAWAEEMQTPMYFDCAMLVANDRMVKYRAHIKAGFTEAQSLELCKS
jgi:hypothetical protein